MKKRPTKLRADDLSPEDRAWAEAIDAVTACGLGEAFKRIRRIRYDKALHLRLEDLQRDLGPDVVITNLVWSGPTMSDLEATVVPHPYNVLAGRPKTVAEYAAGVRRAQTKLRTAVANFELERAFGGGVPRDTLLGLRTGLAGYDVIAKKGEAKP